MRKVRKMARLGCKMCFGTTHEQMSYVRIVETVVWENGVFVPCRKQAVLTEIGENSDVAFYPQKPGSWVLRARTWRKMTKKAGVTRAK